MRVLIVCSGNYKNFNFKVNQAFVYEQMQAISAQINIDFDTFFIKGHGISGYFKSMMLYRNLIKLNNYDLIHAHYGLSGFLAVMQFRIPVVITFHNGEILSFYTNFLSSIASFLSKFNIYVANHIHDRMFFKINKYEIIPCGIDFSFSNSNDKAKAKNKMNLDGSPFLLFGGSFDNIRKNYKLLKNAQLLFPEISKVPVVELKGFSREEVTLLLNACEVLVLPSISEGSPQIIKEAMACNCPIVSTDVGDVRWVIGNTEGCYICTFSPNDVAEKIQMAMEFARTKGRTNGRQRIIELGLDSGSIARRIVEVYKTVAG